MTLGLVSVEICNFLLYFVVCDIIFVKDVHFRQHSTLFHGKTNAGYLSKHYNGVEIVALHGCFLFS